MMYMMYVARNRNNFKTGFIEFNSRKCKACWKCVDICPQKVFGKIDIIIHRHALIKNGDRCTGCGKCAKVCECDAISYISGRR